VHGVSALFCGLRATSKTTMADETTHRSSETRSNIVTIKGGEIISLSKPNQHATPKSFHFCSSISMHAKH